MEPLDHLASLPAVDGHPMAALLIERIPVSVAIVSALREDDGRVSDFCVEYSNMAAAQISDDRTEIYGKPLFDVVPAFREVGLFERFVEALDSGVPVTETGVRMGGSYEGFEYDLNLDVVAIPIGSDHIMSVSHDRTAEHEANVRLTTVQETLSRRQKMERQINAVNAGLVGDLVEVQRALDRGDVDEAKRAAANGALRAAEVVSGLRDVVRTGP